MGKKCIELDRELCLKTSELENLRIFNIDLKIESEELRLNYQKLLEENSTNYEKMRTFKIDNEKLVRNIENLEDTALLKNTEIEKLTIDLSNLKTEITKLNHEKYQLETEKNSLESTITR